MKILHITTSRSGSTGRTASDIKVFFTSKGDEYKIAFSDRDTKPLNGDILIGNRFDHKVHAFLSRLTGLQGYFSYLATKSFLRRVKTYSPDVVVMGNLHANYINLPLLFSFLAKERIPVVMILHDCWFFTGKCTHFTARGCNKWKTECHHCPALKSDNASWFFDRSTKMFRDRKKWYGKLASHTVVAVSEWEKNVATQSPLFSNSNVVRIYNWIDTDVFKPATKEQILKVQEKYNLSTDIKYVISVSAGWSAGATRTQDADKLSRMLPEGYQLIVVGGVEEGVFTGNVVCIPHTSDQAELAALYSLAEAYIHFSVEDTFGKVIAEAMACDTVPIVFNSTACGEITGSFGHIVEPHNVSGMNSSILRLCSERNKLSIRNYTIKNYNKVINVEHYYQLFNRLISNHKND